MLRGLILHAVDRVVGQNLHALVLDKCICRKTIPSNFSEKESNPRMSCHFLDRSSLNPPIMSYPAHLYEDPRRNLRTA